jgi:hypothetical protein
MAFLALLLIFNWKLWKPVIYAAASGLLLSAFRLIPAAFTLAGKKEKFIWSYPTVHDLLDAIVTIRQHTPERLKPWGTTGWWEYDMYLGVLGLAVIAYFGVYLRFRKGPELEDCRFKAFDFPILTLASLSISYFHAFLTRIPLPLIRSQRVAARFIIIPVVFLVFIAAIRMQRVLGTARRPVRFYVAAIIGLAVMALSFVDHSFIWSVARLQRIYRDKVVDFSIPDIIRVEDSSYTSMLVLGGIISLASLVVLVYLALRRRKSSQAGS